MADLVAARIRAAAALPPQSRKRGADGDHRGLRGDEKLRCTPGTEGKAYDAIDVTNLDDRGRKTPTTVTKSDAFEARNTAVPPKSSGSPQRAAGVRLMINSLNG